MAAPAAVLALAIKAQGFPVRAELGQAAGHEAWLYVPEIDFAATRAILDGSANCRKALRWICPTS